MSLKKECLCYLLRIRENHRYLPHSKGKTWEMLIGAAGKGKKKKSNVLVSQRRLGAPNLKNRKIKDEKKKV